MVSDASIEVAKSAVRLVRIEPALQRRHLPLRHENGENVPVLVVIGDGAARLETASGANALRGPCALWLRRIDEARLVAEAGAAGHALLIPEEILARAIGDFFDRQRCLHCSIAPGPLPCVWTRNRCRQLWRNLPTSAVKSTSGSPAAKC